MTTLLKTKDKNKTLKADGQRKKCIMLKRANKGKARVLAIFSKETVESRK